MDGQWVMSEFVAFLGAVRVFAVKLSRNTNRFGRLRCEAVNGIPSGQCVPAEVRSRESYPFMPNDVEVLLDRRWIKNARYCSANSGWRP